MVALQCVLVSAEERSESAIHIRISPLYWISFPFMSPESTEYSSSCKFSIVIYFIRACTHAKSLQLCLIFCDPMDCSLPGSSVNGDSPGKNTGVDCCALLQRIFPAQESNRGLLNCRQILYQLLPGFSSVQFSRSVVSNSLRPHESQHARPPCPSPIPGVHLNSWASSW